MSNSSQLDDLEARVAFQEDSIDKLSEEVALQSKEIDQLKRMVKILHEQIKDSDNSGAAPEANVPPPHY